MELKEFCRRIEKALEGFNLTVKYYKKTGSTSTDAKEYAKNAREYSPVLFLAEEQSSGRGRLGREFISRKNKGIYISLLFYTDRGLENTLSVTTFSATAVALAIERQTGEELGIKWVNDIYNSRGKVCGILTEAVTLSDRTAIIVGIGINYGKEEFPPEIRDIASSVGKLTEQQREEIISDICRELLCFSDKSVEEHLTQYRKRFMLMNCNVNIISAGEVIKSGTVCGVDDNGGLILDIGGKTEIISTGEVSVRLNK